MRLLEALPNGGFRLAGQWYEGSIPPYAILSHRWGEESEEVNFQDITTSEASWQGKAGYRKISLCSLQAARDGLQYFWVDSCCIDKSSSAELSEAINSMYRWYANAKACYAFLEDVTADERSADEIEASTWFKRAWTLQELLAPRDVIFYSWDWSYIGTRNELKDIVSDITGIEAEHITRGTARIASISKRMSWAANREASRPEDIAYSLLGIFDVQMPLLYGEGRYKAFLRLQMEIMKISTDHTLLAWEPLQHISETDSGVLFEDDERRAVAYLSPEDRTFGGGILAPSPANFITSRDLVPIDPYETSPFSMTNAGLSITLRLDQDYRNMENVLADHPSDGAVTAQVVKAVLNCHKESNFFLRVAIPLRLLTKNSFKRHLGAPTSLVSTIDLLSYVPQEIYIQGDWSRPPNNVHSRWCVFALRKISPEIKIVDAYPPDYWQANDKLIQGDSGANEKPWHACLLLEIELRKKRKQAVLVIGMEYDHGRPWLQGELFSKRTKIVFWHRFEDVSDKSLSQIHADIPEYSKGAWHGGYTWKDGSISIRNETFVWPSGQTMICLDMNLKRS